LPPVVSEDGVRSLSAAHGLLELSSEESAAKARLAAACRQVYALFDSSKTTRFTLHPFVSADRVAGLFTDAAFPEAAADDWRRGGAAIHRVVSTVGS
jgi:DeoR family transcriptional regulator of aga operon